MDAPIAPEELPAKLEQALDFYISGANFKQFRLLAPVPFAEASYEVRPVTAAQADAVRADVLLYVRGPKDAEALLQSVLPWVFSTVQAATPHDRSGRARQNAAQKRPSTANVAPPGTGAAPTHT